MIKPGIGQFLIFVTDYCGFKDDPKANPVHSIITNEHGMPFYSRENAESYLNSIKNENSDYIIAEFCLGPLPASF